MKVDLVQIPPPSEDVVHQPKKARLWWTPEFFFYYGLSLFVFYKIIVIVYGISHSSSANYEQFQDDLVPGWIGKYRLFDNSDLQYRDIRNNLTKLTLLMLAYTFFRRLFSFFFCREGTVPDPTTYAEQSFQSKRIYNLVVSLSVVFVLHGFHCIWLISSLSLGYLIAKAFKTHRAGVVLTWTWAVALLLCADLTRNLSFGSLYSGVFSRWYLLFKFSLLRMISYNMDYYYSFYETQQNLSSHTSHCKTCTKIDVHCEKYRALKSHDAKDYNLINYFGYLLYLPLYLSGPIISYNDYLYQLKSSGELSLKNFSKILLYGFRVLFNFLLIELMLHYLYVSAIKNNFAWVNFTPLQFLCLGFVNLILIWLKLMFIWRFSRFWAMVDGITTCENMNRCMLNNYSGIGFWRAWHRSFNQWIIRYIYLPLGGSRYSVFNIWIIFTFVALWHDKELKLLAWGWLVCLFILPEIFIKTLDKKYQFYKLPYYRFLCGVPASSNVYLMCVVNLIGFSVGLDGMKTILNSLLFTGNGLCILLFIYCIIFCGTQLMFEIREEEKRHGVYKNY